jgi:hypothetical protein
MFSIAKVDVDCIHPRALQCGAITIKGDVRNP